MSEETMERDLELADALRATLGEVPDDQVDWSGLREAVGQRAAPALARQRAARLRRRLYAPGVAVAASVALLIFAVKGPQSVPQEGPMVSGSTAVTLEEML